VVWDGLLYGTYTFSVVNPSLNAAATYTAWTYNSPWITNYLVFDQADESQDLFGGATTYTFAADTTLVFATPDAGVVRNGGAGTAGGTPAATVDPLNSRAPRRVNPGRRGAVLDSLDSASLPFNPRYSPISTADSIQ